MSTRLVDFLDFFFSLYLFVSVCLSLCRPPSFFFWILLPDSPPSFPTHKKIDRRKFGREMWVFDSWAVGVERKIPLVVTEHPNRLSSKWDVKNFQNPECFTERRTSFTLTTIRYSWKGSQTCFPPLHTPFRNPSHVDNINFGRSYTQW